MSSIFAWFWSFLFFGQLIAYTQNDGEGCAELMGDVGEETALKLVHFSKLVGFLLLKFFVDLVLVETFDNISQ